MPKPGCPAWCEDDHGGGDMHYRVVGRVQYGPASIEVNLRYLRDSIGCDPPLITVEAWNAPATTVPGLPATGVRPNWAGNLADLLVVLGTKISPVSSARRPPSPRRRGHDP